MSVMPDNDTRDEGARQQYGLKPYDPRDSAPSSYIRYLDYEPEKEVQFQDYVNVILKRKRIVLAFFISVVVTTALFTSMVTPLYKSTVVIKIDKESPNILSFKEVQAGFDVDYYTTQLEILKSRSVAERVIKKLSLDKNADFAPVESELSKPANELIDYVKNVVPGGLSFVSPQNTIKGSSDVHGRMQEDPSVSLVNYLMSNLEVKPVKNCQLAQVSFSSHRPDLAVNVANAVADACIEYDLQSRIDASSAAKDFLEKQSMSVKRRWRPLNKNSMCMPQKMKSSLWIKINRAA